MCKDILDIEFITMYTTVHSPGTPAIPAANLEFAALCLRNALFLLPEDPLTAETVPPEDTENGQVLSQHLKKLNYLSPMTSTDSFVVEFSLRFLGRPGFDSQLSQTKNFKLIVVAPYCQMLLI